MAHADEQIVNPRTGQAMIFHKTARDTDSALLRVETINPPHGPAEPEHVHPEQESSAEVFAGTLHFSIRGETRIVRTGEKIVIPPGTPHYFWNEGEEEARAIQEFRPALAIEDFFRTYVGLARDGKLNARGMPNILQTAVLTRAYWREIRVTSPPTPVQRIFTTLVEPLGRLRGYQAGYTSQRDAP